MENTIRRAAELLKQADAILVGGGSGLSSAAGYNHYHNDSMYREHFQEFDDKYGIKYLMKGFYYVYSKPEQQWGFYCKYIDFMRKAPAGEPYLNLKKCLDGKKYHILTTNVDGQFSKVFPEEKICCFQGDFRYFQCSQPCHDEIYDNQQYIEEMLTGMHDLEVPYDLIPRCPECGWKMVPWVQDDTFLRGTAWKERYQRYVDFLIENHDKKLVLLELGVGDMTPSIIQLPFWDIAAKNPDTYLINVTLDKTTPPLHLKGKILNFIMDISDFLKELKAQMALLT